VSEGKSVEIRLKDRVKNRVASPEAFKTKKRDKVDYN